MNKLLESKCHAFPPFFPMGVTPEVHDFILLLILWLWYRLNYKNNRYVLVFVFAFKEINRSPQLLPNVSLGFHVYNSFHSDVSTLDSTMRWSLGGGQKIPNDTCQAQIKVVTVTAGATPAFSAQIGTLLELYKYHGYEHGGGMDLERLKISS